MTRRTVAHPFFARLPFLIVLGASAKLLVDTTVQLYNPFLVVIATGAGIGTVAMGRIVALRGLVGLVSPLLGALADRVGYRAVMRTSLLVVGLAMIAAPLAGSSFLFALAVVLSGVGVAGYTPNLHAYLSAKLPYEKRATGLGIIEYSWALAGIVGLFVSGYLIESFSWRAPFFLLGGGLVAMALLFGLLPKSEAGRRAAADGSRSPAVPPSSPPGLRKPSRTSRRPLPGRLAAAARSFLDLGAHARSAWAAIAMSGFNMFAMMHIMIIHGGWLGDEYGLSPARLGTVALLFGLTDLSASVSVSLFVDRIGKRRSVIIGVAGMVAGFALLPFLNLSLPLAVASIALPRVFFEFAVVSNFPLLSEQAPQARGKVMSLGITAGLLGATLAGLTGPSAYLALGVWGLGPVSTAAAVVSLVLLLAFVREGSAQPGRDE